MNEQQRRLTPHIPAEQMRAILQAMYRAEWPQSVRADLVALYRAAATQAGFSDHDAQRAAEHRADLVILTEECDRRALARAGASSAMIRLMPGLSA